MKLRVAEFENVVSFAFAWWRHVMTSCHDVKTGGTLSQLVEVLEMILFCFYSFPACRVQKCYRFCVCMMSWFHDVTSWCHKTGLLLYQLVDVLKWWYTCISVIISIAGFQANIVYVLAWCLHVITWRHDVTKITTWRQETNCLHPSLPNVLESWFHFVSVISLVAKLNVVIVVVFAWWNNVTKWRHDVIKHAVSISACRRDSEMVLFCFYSISGWQVQKYHWFCICICGYVIMWRYDVMTWLYDVT